MTWQAQGYGGRGHAAVLGLGEAGSAIAAGLAAAGLAVAGYDPRVTSTGARGVRIAESVVEAVDGADLILSLVTAAAAEDVLAEAVVVQEIRRSSGHHDAAESAAPAPVWADLNTAAPELKERLSALAARGGYAFADVALLAPVPGRGLATPALACGPGAARLAALLNPLGGAVEVVDGPPGTAAARKLLRSVCMKGMAALVLESLAAARAAGCEPWMRQNLADQLGAELVERLETGSKRHAARRVAEVEAARALLESLGVPARVTTAARDWLADLAAASPPGSAGDAASR
jgi:3-hydroxyisobutyrate dehydrogenase-like beta-hydroxyacid dehydrogenase